MSTKPPRPDECREATITGGDQRMAGGDPVGSPVITFGVRSAILAGLILSPLASTGDAIGTLHQPPLSIVAGPDQSTCCPHHIESQSA